VLSTSRRCALAVLRVRRAWVIFDDELHERSVGGGERAEVREERGGERRVGQAGMSGIDDGTRSLYARYASRMPHFR
jgi:hypothetical protein